MFKLFKSYNEKELDRINKKYIRKIDKLNLDIEKLSDEELKYKTNELLKRIEEGESEDKILSEAFAVCSESAKRTLGLKPYTVQLIGGIVLYQGRIAEMKTGEGKTLVATLPSYLNALFKKKTYIVTVNDYLAKRDFETMKPLYDFLGVTSGFITSETPKEVRKEIYKNSIIYITNSELGFDYLKDNMVLDVNDKIQGELDCVIIDEADSILIDEARTPLIIAKSLPEINKIYDIVGAFVSLLEDDDIILDKKEKVAILNEKGVLKAERTFGIENYSDFENNELRHYIKQGLHAKYIMTKDIDYIVKDNKILIIDEFTGRIGENRKFSNGLHQSIETKEGIPIQNEDLTLASITYPNFFKIFKKLSGMTGTAITEQEEFNEIYNLDVIAVPTNKPIKRIDKEDKLYMKEEYKINAIVNDIKRCYKNKRPVLVGTQSVEKSELISSILKKENIPHNLLNAKNHKEESEIISKAGELGSVTIATNMAGRGTDIKLGEGVKEIGGLKIIGTERGNNRRVDNQLRGRAGRQGDVGESQFYISFDDELVRYLPDRYKDMFSNLNRNDKKYIKNNILFKMINSCQKTIESKHFEVRKNLLKYDDIIDNQRQLIYKEREEVLLSNNTEEILYSMIESFYKNAFYKYKTDEEINYFIENVCSDLVDTKKIDMELLSKTPEILTDYFIRLNREIVSNKAQELGDKKEEIFKNIILSNVDFAWQRQMEEIECLKRNSNLANYKQGNPVDEFIMQSNILFEDMIFELKIDIFKNIYNINVDYM